MRRNGASRMTISYIVQPAIPRLNRWLNRHGPNRRRSIGSESWMFGWSFGTCGTDLPTGAATTTLITAPPAEPRKMHLAARQSSGSTIRSLPERIRALRRRFAGNRSTRITPDQPGCRRPSCVRITVAPVLAVPARVPSCLLFPAAGRLPVPVAITGTLGAAWTAGVLWRPLQPAWEAGARCEMRAGSFHSVYRPLFFWIYIAHWFFIFISIMTLSYLFSVVVFLTSEPYIHRTWKNRGTICIFFSFLGLYVGCTMHEPHGLWRFWNITYILHALWHLSG